MIIVADKNGATDSAYHTFVKHINTSVPIVMVSWVEDFVFNDALLSVKDYILICYSEYGWDFDLEKSGSHIWGGNSEKFPRYYNNDWIKFDNWVKENPPQILFKRELLKKDVTDKVKPIEYPSVVNKEWPIDTRYAFNQRPINVFQYWGRSNEHRLRIHAEILMHSYKKGFQACDNIYYLEKYLSEERCEKWATIWIPHYYRIPIENLLDINNLSKLSLSWPGAGFKCFRTLEAPGNSVMVMHRNSFAWAYDWDETNCILVEPGKEIEGIEAALKNDNLYDVYLNGIENCREYQVENYISDYIMPLINHQ